MTQIDCIKVVANEGWCLKLGQLRTPLGNPDRLRVICLMHDTHDIDPEG